MTRFDRYFLRRQLMVFGFFALVLVMIYWINRAVALFDQLIADGQSAGVFLELTILSLPAIVRSILPISAFIATLYATNRLVADSEMVITESAGLSPFRRARGVLVFGLLAALMMAVLGNLLVPTSTAELNMRQAEISRSATARLLHEGQFLAPAEGVTLYAREVTPDGELRDLFLQDDRHPSERVTYTATSAYLVRTSGGGVQLVMIAGMMQRLTLPDGQLQTTGFEDLAYDVGALLPSATSRGRALRELPTLALLNPSEALLDETGRSKAQVLVEAHGRIADPFLTMGGALLGFATLMIGGFSRFGLWRQIALAVGLVILVQALEAATGSAASANAAHWPLVYLPAATTFAMAGAFMWLAANPRILARRRLA